MSLVFAVFFFKQKTAYEMRISDWSSDVCSSDLEAAEVEAAAARSATQLLLFRDTNQRVRGVRLSVIERVEEVPALALFESAGEIGRASCRERVCQYV